MSRAPLVMAHCAIFSVTTPILLKIVSVIDKYDPRVYLHPALVWDLAV